MNYITDLRTEQINNFMSEFDDLRCVSEREIVEGLKRIIGEEPAVDFEYKSNTALNEATGAIKFDKELVKIHILYSYVDDGNIPKIGKKSYIVG